MKFSKGQLAKILYSYGIHDIKISGDEIICCCPFHKEQNPSFSINSITGSFICFSGKCGVKGDFFRFKSLMEGITYDEAKKEVNNNSSQFYYKNLLEESLESLKIQNEEFKTETNHTETLQIEPLLNFTDYKDILQKINITEEIAIKANLGICLQKPYLGRLAIPIVKDNITYWELRDLTKKSSKKCLYTKGTKVGKLLFFIKMTDDKCVFLCEGTKDAMSIAGFGFNACCCFGINISKEQLSLILKNGFEKIFVMYDNDEAGKNALKKNFPYIKNFIDAEPIFYPDNFSYKDPNEIETKEEFLKVLNYNA